MVCNCHPVYNWHPWPQIPNHQSFNKKAFLIQPLIQNIFQTNLERVPVTKAMGANYKRGDNYKPSRASRGSTHLLLYSGLRRVYEGRSSNA